jgi:uncharacterized protein YndB with AHSA1/START domain
MREVAPDKIISKTIVINTPASKVWAAITAPEIMRVWMTDAEMNIYSDWKTGGAIVFRGDLHGIPYENKGTILQFEPEKVFEYSYWSSLSQQADIPENYSLITFRLTPGDRATTLNFTQSNFLAETTYRHFLFYWNTALELMKKLVEGQAPSIPGVSV